ncbi:MAG TPA: carbonate dehydratase [Planctomycetota bacterium]|nr:carbonate dehydratase [Planctomycetota bacterium]
MPTHSLAHLLEANRRWSEGVKAKDPQFFERLAAQQTPELLWIGCSDSRVPANQIVGLAPGEVFVHRNVGNVVARGDLNGQSVLQFAVDVLKVRHVIVCGHYGCGGVLAALDQRSLGLVDGWIQHIREVRTRHAALLGALMDRDQVAARLCELNVLEQVTHVATADAVRRAWKRGQELSVHGWIYDIHDGRLRDLGLSLTRAEDLEPARRAALAQDGRA